MPIEFAPPQSNVNYQITPPQYTDPLQTLSQIGQLRTQGLQQQSAQQELQANQLKNQQAQEDFADQQKMRKVYSDWSQSGNPKLDDLITQAGQAGVGPRTLIPLQQQILDHRQKLATAKEAEFKNTASAQAQTTQGLNAVASVPADQPDQRAAAWQTERGKLIAGGFATPDDIPAVYPGDQAFEELRHHNRTSQQELDLIKEQREAQAAQLEAAPKQRAQAIADLQTITPAGGVPTPAQMAALQKKYPTVQFPPGTPTPQSIAQFVRGEVAAKDQPEYDIKQSQARAVLAYANADPKALEAEVDAMIPATDPMNASTKTLLRGAMSRGDIQAIPGILKDAYDQKAKVAYATNPAIRDAEVQKAVATEQATAPLKLNQQIAAAKALRQGDNPAVAGVAPAAVGQVQNQAIKLDEQYAKEKSAADAIGKVLDLVESGNKAAGTNLPLLGVGALNAINGIKRINSAEIHQYEQAGSLWDRIVGKVEKLTTGQPIPKDVLDDIRSLHQTLGQQSYQSYNDALNSLNGRTGAKFAPTLGPPNVRQAPAQRPPGVSAMAIEVPLKSGKTAWMNPDAAAKFKHDHPELVK